MICMFVAWAGGNALVRMFSGPKPITSQEVRTQIDREFANSSATLMSLKRHFPDFYETLLSKLSVMAASNKSKDEIREASRKEVYSFRARYLGLVSNASDGDLKLILKDNLEIYRAMLAQRGTSQCDRFFREGVAAIPSDFVRNNQALIDKTAAHTFEIIRRTIDGKLKSPGDPSDEDWRLMTVTMQANGATDAEMEKLATAETDPKVRDLCPVGIKMIEAVISQEGLGGHRVRSGMIKLILQ